MLELKNVSKRYEDNVLEQIDFELGEKEFVYLTGASGAGKSTLLGVMAGNILKSEGQIFFRKKEMDFSSDEDLRAYKKEVQLVPQASTLDEGLTIFENCQYFQADDSEIEKWLEALGVGQLRRCFPGEVSGGELARANLARTILMRPKVLLLDEGTAALDGRTAKLVMRVLGDLNQAGVSIIFSTHNFELLEHFPHRHVELLGGKLYER